MLKSLLMALVVVWFVLPGCTYRTAPLVNPDPIVVRSQSEDQTRERIWHALQRRRWLVTADEPGEITAKLSRSDYSATIRVEYDAETIDIDYVDSRNLKYRKTRKGKEYIHQNYMKWVHYLLRDMSVQPRLERARRPEQPQTPRPTVIAGSGFLLGESLVATNYHVVEGGRLIRCFVGGEAVGARILSHDKGNDLALLKLDRAPRQAVTLHLGSSSDVRQGQEVYAMGYPLTTLLGEKMRVLKGIVSSLVGFQSSAGELQLGMSINPGNSGGPVLDSRGNVVAIVTSKIHQFAMLDSGSIPEGVAFAVKVEYLRALAQVAGVTDQLSGVEHQDGMALTEITSKYKPAVVRIEAIP